jgi:pimeloyl-ACP methyl ester carboxylesterase
VGPPDRLPGAVGAWRPGSRLLCPDEDATAAAGVRLLTVDRPGYGGSDPRPDPTLLDWADDVQALADRLRLERFAMVGWSAGGGYALACAAGMPGRISAVGLACCEGPYDEVPGALEQGMTPQERTLFEFIRRDPIAARQAVAAHVGWYENPDTIREWEREGPEVDVPILARPDVRDALTQMWREGARQGVGGLDGDPDDGELAGQPALGGGRADRLPDQAVPAVGGDLGREQAVGEADHPVVLGRHQQRYPASSTSPASSSANQPVSTSVSKKGAAPWPPGRWPPAGR